MAPDLVPAHVGIIMDGNGRWARERNLPRTHGHGEGLKAAKRIVRAASDLGIRCLSLYAFSTENWKRATDEVSYLMDLIKTHLKQEFRFYRENGVRVVHSGNRSGLPADILAEIDETARETAGFTGLTVNLLVNYGGRDEIIRAANKASETGALTEKSLSAALDNPEFPELDLLIRTGREYRISNFLLWQSAYAELWFSDKYWPDWEASDLAEAVAGYQKRNRRFGSV
jgi:undecaprenyl diphosphate synthase